MRFLFLVSMFIALGVGAPAFADAVSDAERAYGAGDYDAAIRHLRDAEREIKDRVRRFKAYLKLREWIVEQFEKGEHRRTRDLLQVAVRLLEDQNAPRHQVPTMGSLANVQSILGNYQEAEVWMQRALAAADKRRELRAQVLGWYGYLDYNLRRYAAADAHADQAIALAEAPQVKIDCRVLKGAIRRQQGGFTQAIKEYGAALEELRRLEGRAGRLSLESGIRNLGEVYKARAEGIDLDLATGYFKSALKIARELDAPLQIALTLGQMGEVAHKRGKYAEAERLYKEVIERFKALHYADGVARYTLFLGDLHRDRQEWQQAAHSYDEASRRYRNLSDREFLRLALYGLGRCAEAQADRATAEARYREAVDVVQALRAELMPEEREHFERTSDDLYDRLVTLLKEQGKDADAMVYAGRSWGERVRSRQEGAPSLALGRQGELARQYGLMVAHLEGGGKEAAVRLRDLERSRESLLAADQRLQDAKEGRTLLEGKDVAAKYVQTRADFRRKLTALGEAYPGVLPQLDLHPVRLLRLIRDARFGDDRAVVVYFVAPERLHIFVGTKARIWSKTVDVPRTELRRKIVRYRAHIDANRDSVRGVGGRRPPSPEERRDDFEALSRELHALLVAPVEAHLVELEDDGGVGTVGIIPMDKLAALPFQALIGERAGETKTTCWIERLNIVYLSYLNLEHTVRPGRRELGRDARVVVLADPTGDLPNAVREGEAIVALYPEGRRRLYRGVEATSANLRESWTNADIVHLAAHASLEGKAPYVQLAGARLTPREIAVLPKTDRGKLIVLSACSTGLAENDPDALGTHLETLASAFSAQQRDIGHTIIATLWDVDDKSTSVFMRRFYHALQEGRAPYDALRATQQWMLNGRGDPDWRPRFEQPYHWAPFVFVGSW